VNFVAKTFFGLEDLLTEEISSLGGKNIQKLNRAVSFEGDLETLYAVNLWARTALRVLKPIAHFSAHNETVLYKRLRRIRWNDFMDVNQTFVVRPTINSKIFTHSRYVALKTKDAIVDQFRDSHDGRRPSISFEEPDVSIDIHCSHNQFSIALDSSGDSLHKRRLGRRDSRAPLNEALAAGIILSTGWTREIPLYDPMCGSGTFLIEAAMIGKNIPPRINWTEFAFMKWPDFRKDLWQTILQNARNGISEVHLQIAGSDKDRIQVSRTKSLLEFAKMENDILIRPADFLSSPPPFKTGILIMNPPYGERLQQDDIEMLYKKMGDQLKSQYNGWTAWIFSGNKDAIKKIGLKTSRRLTLFNGPIESKLHCYDLYQGTRKGAFKKESEN
jgi:putative N6-adenine-specific DNA methylase